MRWQQCSFCKTVNLRQQLVWSHLVRQTPAGYWRGSPIMWAAAAWGHTTEQLEGAEISLCLSCSCVWLRRECWWFALCSVMMGEGRRSFLPPTEEAISPFQRDFLQDRGKSSFLACLRAKTKSVETASLPLLHLGSFLRAGTKVSQCLASLVTLYMSHGFLVEERKQRNSGWALRCNLFEKQLLDLWPIYIVENVCRRENMGWDLCRWTAGKPDDPPWSSTQREVSQLGCYFLSQRYSGMKYSQGAWPRFSFAPSSPSRQCIKVSSEDVMMCQEPQWAFVKNIMSRVSPVIKLR